MLEGVRSGPIIAGAYPSPEGTCPMLAAHRRGDRTSLATFARAWDSYTGAPKAREREARRMAAGAPASRREPTARGSASTPDADPASRHRSASVPGDTDRSGELRGRPGWAWLRVFRRLDDYEAAVALAQVRAEGADLVERPGALVGAPADN